MCKCNKQCCLKKKKSNSQKNLSIAIDEQNSIAINNSCLQEYRLLSVVKNSTITSQTIQWWLRYCVKWKLEQHEMFIFSLLIDYIFFKAYSKGYSHVYFLIQITEITRTLLILLFILLHLPVLQWDRRVLRSCSDLNFFLCRKLAMEDLKSKTFCSFCSCYSVDDCSRYRTWLNDSIKPFQIKCRKHFPLTAFDGVEV